MARRAHRRSGPSVVFGLMPDEDELEELEKIRAIRTISRARASGVTYVGTTSGRRDWTLPIAGALVVALAAVVGAGRLMAPVAIDRSPTASPPAFVVAPTPTAAPGPARPFADATNAPLVDIQLCEGATRLRDVVDTSAPGNT